MTEAVIGTVLVADISVPEPGISGASNLTGSDCETT